MRLALLACAHVSFALTVNCNGTQKQIDPSLPPLYQAAFGNFQESKSRTGADTLNFETLAGLAGVSSLGADMTEFWVNMATIENQVDNVTVSLADVKRIWFGVWHDLGNTLLQEADTYVTANDTLSAISALHRASTYLQLAVRFESNLTAPDALEVYKLSVTSFQRAISLTPRWPFLPPCEVADIPYKDQTGTHQLHGYFCSALPESGGLRPTIIMLTGYDGTAELTYHEGAVAATAYGYNVLVLEGPGQGYVARFSGLTFRADYEVVGSQALSWLLSAKAGVVDPNQLVIWGRSFGGYLAPRAFASESRFKALVADGGVFDFFQVLFCKFDPSLQEMFETDPAKFDATLTMYRNYSLSLDFLLAYGTLGFGTSTPSQLFQALQSYNLSGKMSLFANRPVYVNDPPLDAQVGNASQIFFSMLEKPLSPLTFLNQPPAMRGAGLHCSVGSTNNGVGTILRWLGNVF